MIAIIGGQLILVDGWLDSQKHADEIGPAPRTGPVEHVGEAGSGRRHALKTSSTLSHLSCRPKGFEALLEGRRVSPPLFRPATNSTESLQGGGTKID